MNARFPLLLALSLSALPACDRKPESADHAAHEEHDDEEHARGNPEEAASASRSLHLAPEAVQRSGIKVGEVVTTSAAGGIEVPAEIRVEPDRQAHVASVVSGQLAKVLVNVGDRVEAGQTLCVLRSVALGEARAAAARSRADVEVARSNFERQKTLRDEGIGAERQYLEAQGELRRAEAAQSAAQRALEVYGRGGSGSEVNVNSPIAGRIVSRHATVGEVVSPTDVLFEVVEISKVWAIGHVYQKDASRVKDGADAMLTLRSQIGTALPGKLDYVAPALDETTRTLPVRMTLENPEGVLRPGSFGTLTIAPLADEGRAQTVVSLSALQKLDGETVVFVPGDADGEFRAVSVQVASRGGGLAVISSGLSAGQKYVSQGGFVLKSELSRSQLGEGHAH